MAVTFAGALIPPDVILIIIGDVFFHSTCLLDTIVAFGVLKSVKDIG